MNYQMCVARVSLMSFSIFINDLNAVIEEILLRLVYIISLHRVANTWPDRDKVQHGFGSLSELN